MDLIKSTISAVAEYDTWHGTGDFEIVGGKTLKLESSPHGEDYMEFELPEGSTYQVKIKMFIKEL